jgi:CBS domain containing-hemolysin-like protein
MRVFLYLFASMLLILANAFFVASEFAIVRIRPTRLEQLAAEGNTRARVALQITRRLDAYLSANQLGITLASIALGWIGEPAIYALIVRPLRATGSASVVTEHAIATVLAFFLVTSLHTVLGELVPKSFAIQRTEKLALLTARPLHFFFLAMWPIIWLLNAAANAVVHAFGLGTARDADIAHTSEELRLLLTRNPVGLDPALRSLLVRVFDLRRRTARHVMTLRSDAVTLRSDVAIPDAVAIAGDAGYSRYPVVDASSDKALGYVHLRDLFDVMRGCRHASTVVELVRRPIFTRENTSIERLRLDMQAQQVPMAIVVSPQGDFVGLVTIEDLLEEIVGEIRDENDEEVPPIHRRGGGAVDVDGRVLLSDLERDAAITLSPPVSGIETLGGYVIARLERLPETGARLECEGYTLIVLDAAGRRVRRVRILANEEPTDVRSDGPSLGLGPIRREP